MVQPGTRDRGSSHLVRKRPWSHYAAPAAFLLAATVLVVLVHSAVNHPATGPTTVVAPPPALGSAPTAPRFYTVVAGDTFEVISSKTHVPVAQIQQLNPNVQSTALYIGQKLRLR